MVTYFMDNANSPQHYNFLTLKRVGNIEPRLVFEDDRQILAQEQKACRARARKFSQENNRRRKAQEERRKAEEAQAQKLQEEILQQRRQRLLEATERHQRAHLPPSQRKRPPQTVSGRPATSLDNALRRIEGTFSLCDLHFPLHSASPRTYRRCHSSSVVSSKPRPQRQLSAALAYVKLLQEKSANDLQNAELLFRRKLWEKQHPLEEKRANFKQVKTCTAEEKNEKPKPAEENPHDADRSDQTEILSILDIENSQHSPSHSAGHSPTSSHSHTACPSDPHGPAHTCGLSQTSGHSHTPGQSHSAGHTPDPSHSAGHTHDPSHSSGHTHDPSHSAGHTHDPSHSAGRTPDPSHSAGHAPDPYWTAATGNAPTSWLSGSPPLGGCPSQSPAECGNGGRRASVTSRERQEEASLSSRSSDSEETQEPGDEGPLGGERHGGEEGQPRPETEPGPVETAPPCQGVRAAPAQSETPAGSHRRPCPQSGFSDGAPQAAPRRAWTSPDPPPTERSGPTAGERAAESLQQTGNHLDLYSRHVSISYIALPSRENSRGKGSLLPSRTPVASLSTAHQTTAGPVGTLTANTEPWQPSRIYTQRTDANANPTLCKDKERECPENSDPSNRMKKSYLAEPGISNGTQMPARDRHKLPSEDSACDTVSGSSDAKSIKGILKKQSKYVPALPTPFQTYGSFYFPKQAASSMRERGDLAKVESKEPESVRKRLRWFDEECSNSADEGSGGWEVASEQTGGKDTPPLLSVGRPSAGQVVAPVTSSGYHFAKRVWSDSRSQEGAPQSRLGKNSSPRGGSLTPRVPRRAGSAPPGPRLLSDRRGVGVRPEFATGNSWTTPRGGGTPGRMLVPRPPPRTGRGAGDTAGLSPSNEPPACCGTPEHHTAMTVSGLTFTPFPPPCTLPPSTPEISTKAVRTSNHLDPPDSTDDASGTFPNSATTGQEVQHLWTGIRSTLVPKGSNSGFHSWVFA